MKLIRPLALWLCLLAPLSLAAQEKAASAGKRPNVLFIVCDDLNTHVSTSGYNHISTPTLDELAAAGTRFLRTYCQYPVCGPSRSSFLSGLYPESTRVLDNKSDIRQERPGIVPLPEQFRKNGYWTAGVGKIFHTMKTDPGESCWYEYERFENERNPVLEKARKEFEAENGSIEKASNRRAWRLKQKEAKRGAGGQKIPGYGPTDMSDEEHKDGRNVRRVVSWLDKKSHGARPFFIACGIQKPHVPFWAPKKYFDMYPREKLVTPPALVGDWEDIPALAMVKRFKAFGFELDKENYALRRAYTQAYHACVSFIDAQLGLLLSALKRNGRWEDTIIIFISDHGYHLGEHYMWGKVSLFEECARVPMIVRVPGRTRAGTSASGLTELVDLYPTLCKLCGIKAPAHLQGESFTRLIDNPSGEGKETAYTVVSRGKTLGRSIRTVRWRYAEWGSSSESELYDLEKDPAEHHNLAGDEKFNEPLAKMRRLLEKARQRGS